MKWNKPIWREYLLALGATVLALLARMALDPLVGDRVPYYTFIVAVAVTTSYGGLGASLTAVVLGGLAAQWFVTSPRQTFSVIGVTEQVGIVGYFLVSLALVGFGQAVRRSRQQAEAMMNGLRREVAERKRSEEALRAQQEQLRLITDTAPVYIAHCDTEGRYKFVNQGYAERFRVRPEECVGKTIADIVGSEVFGTIRTYVDQALAGTRVDFEVDVPSDESGTRCLYCTYVPEFHADGTVNGLVAVISDITRRKAGERALAESEERLRAFAGQLEQLVEERTEELVQSQNRLRALATELSLTEQRERKRLAMELHDHLAQMLVLGKMKLSQMKHVSDLAPTCLSLVKEADEVLTQSLTYTRTLVTNLAPPVLHDFGLPAALRWLAEQMLPHQLAVDVTVSDRALPLAEDQAVLLFQSVRELLMNAAKHAGAGKAAILLDEEAGALHIQVHDDGKGFDPAAAIGAAAAGGSAATAMSSKFGLFSIRERMRAMGGKFEIESAPGRGTTARLTLPLGGETLRVKRQASSVEEGSESGAASPITDPSRPGLSRLTDHPSRPNRIRVLLVDDHAMVRQGLRSVLEGYADVDVVGEAVNGEEAVDCVAKLEPALVVMDINMPKMNGIEATAVIKSRYPETFIIGLSVNAKGESQSAMIAAGAALLLTKEAAVDELYQAIQDVMSGKVASGQ